MFWGEGGWGQYDGTPSEMESQHRHKILSMYSCCVLQGKRCSQSPFFSLVTPSPVNLDRLDFILDPQGETLHCRLHVRKHALSANRAISIASQVAKGMGYLHARQIVHRDLKTRNIFIEANYKAVIADFALFNFVQFCKSAK